jgi:hypothetical protein
MSAIGERLEAEAHVGNATAIREELASLEAALARIHQER